MFLLLFGIHLIVDFKVCVFVLRREETDSDSGEAELEALFQKIKRLDKMKFYGGLGKRSGEEADENDLQKRLDKMRFYGGLGKRPHEAKKKSESASGQISKSKKSKIDRLRYMGNLGK